MIFMGSLGHLLSGLRPDDPLPRERPHSHASCLGALWSLPCAASSPRVSLHGLRCSQHGGLKAVSFPRWRGSQEGRRSSFRTVNIHALEVIYKVTSVTSQWSKHLLHKVEKCTLLLDGDRKIPWQKNTWDVMYCARL